MRGCDTVAFLAKLLARDPKKRPTAAEALSDPFVGYMVERELMDRGQALEQKETVLEARLREAAEEEKTLQRDRGRVDAHFAQLLADEAKAKQLSAREKPAS